MSGCGAIWWLWCYLGLRGAIEGAVGLLGAVKGLWSYLGLRGLQGAMGGAMELYRAMGLSVATGAM